VLLNLQNAFPEKSEQEIKHIANKFYAYFCDLILEAIKSMTISYKTLSKRFYVPKEFLAIFEQYQAQGQSVFIVMGHQGNWEWAGNAFGMQCPHQLYAIFKPLHNKHFNELITKIRTRFHTKLITNRAVAQTLHTLDKEHILSATVFLADQTPSHQTAYWTQFLNQETPVYWGLERTALSLNYPIIYAHIHRSKRGYYEVRGNILVEKPSEHKTPGTISELHTRAIEADIIAQPETWLWTHRRWKHKKKKQ
jgi:KDO2-lipid IV(A) lauroyltransferase